MINISVKTKWNGSALEKKLGDTTFKTLDHAAAALRLTARRSIRRNKKASAPGTPPHTRVGRLRDSILYYVDRTNMVAYIGPSAAMVGPSGAAHEFGGTFRARRYDKRPFMKPALDVIAPRLPQTWAASFTNT